MKSLTIEVDEEIAKILESLPSSARRLLTTQALSAILKGELYPVGPEQLELAIELAESGVNPELISRLTRLNPDAFEDFISK
jgi:hypothetical protein